MDNKKRSGAADMLVGIILVIFALTVVIFSVQLETPKVSKGLLDHPGFFPALVGITLVIFGIALTITGIKADGVRQIREIFTAAYQKAFWRDDRSVRVLVLLGLMLCYVLLLQFARQIWAVVIGVFHNDLGGPFIWFTVLYLFATLCYLEATDKWWKNLLISVITAVLIAAAFRYGFQIRLPGQ